RATCMGSPEVQHMQPPGISRMNTSPSAAPIRRPSIPTSPNSLTSTAQGSPAGLPASSDRIAVVLPAPRKPVMMLVGMGESIRFMADSKARRLTAGVYSTTPPPGGEGRRRKQRQDSGQKVGTSFPPDRIDYAPCRAGTPPATAAHSAPVAQLDRALPSGGKGQRFESSRVRQIKKATLAVAFLMCGQNSNRQRFDK